MSARILYLLFATLVLAGIVHISVVLLVPEYGNRDAARQIISDTPVNQFVTRMADGAGIFAEGDPFFETASCRYDLDEAGVVVSGEETDIFWSLAVFNNRGRVVYSLNRKSAIANRLNVIVVNPVQMARLRQFDPARIERSIVVETQEALGFVVVRILEREGEEARQKQRFLDSLSCQAYLEAAQPETDS